ncbi:MAG: hypothetical protein Q8922_11545 [Bacteroidota bacterium]|nr:hypothetical protein [Bacteroidota bacterium]MDP4234684.1 hypothetical protein [Bacteroidota bacterium]MDP4243847.1 hypothetical protein [Bacteroidota bacterium]MDP4288560.1 hypothetical protein [Bacteroidota bacterium]
MNGNTPQSWFDFPVMPTMDPRAIVQTISLEDNAGVQQAATFTRSTLWLHAGVWANPPLIVTQSPSVIGSVSVPNTYDYDSIEQAAAWNSLHLMTAPSTGFPLAVEKIMFLKAGSAFLNHIPLDWTGGTTAHDIQFSFRDNSVTSGDFTAGSNGTIPAFAFPTAPTYGGTARDLQVTVLRTGRFSVALRILDIAGNWSLYEMDWIVL